MNAAVLITGCATGIGEACALGLDRDGFTVFAGVRKEEDADKLANAGSDRLRPILLDITKPDQIAAAIEAVRAGGQPLAGLVNNAGITVNAPMEYIDLDDLRWQIEVNVIAQVAMSQAAIPLLREAKGRIVNVSSVGGFFATPLLGPYNASKFALEGLSDALRRELRPWGIHVAVLQPASIATAIWEKGWDQGRIMREKYSGNFEAHYGKLIDRVLGYMKEQAGKAVSPDVVLNAVRHALTSPSPKTRYRMGGGVWQPVLMARLPDKWVDALMARALNHQ